LRFAWVSAVADAPLLMFGKAGIARHEGTTYKLDAIRYQGSPPMVTALATGEIDLASLGFPTLPPAVINAGMSDLRIIADLFRDGVPGYYSNRFVVLNDGPVRTVDDLKGRIAAVNSTGSTIDIALRAMLEKHGLQDKRDVTIIEVGFPNMPAMLTGHKVDIIAGGRQFVDDPKFRASMRTLFTQADALGGPSEMGLLAARQSFLERNRAAVVDFLEDELRARRWYTDPAHHDESIDIIAKATKIPVASISGWLLTTGDYYRDPDGRPDLDAVRSNIAIERQLGYVKGAIDTDKMADLSYVKEAAARLR
jgi:NitT/TauT family transport system substrate-binding protein